MIELVKAFVTSLTILLGLAAFFPVFAQASPAVSARQASNSGKLQACRAHEAAINQRFEHLTQLVANMEEKFDSIATRVENHYTNKAVATGKTISNYTALTSDIQTKKTAVQVALIVANNDAKSFSCSLGDPKATLTKYRKDMQATKSALKDYRTSIKNLIVAVRRVVGD